MPSPNITSTTLDESEGVKEREDAISMELDEERINKILGDRVEKGKSFYDSKLELTEVRKKNEERWLNKNLEVSGHNIIYDHQLAYRDNRIFISVETLTASLVPKTPVPEVIEAHDTNASRELAWNYEKVLMRTAQDLNVKAHLRMATRHVLMGYRCGVIKGYWDFKKGVRLDDGSFTGSPIITHVRPHKIVIDADATDPDDIPLIAETLSATVEELTIDFPDKKDEIIKEFLGNKDIDTEKVDLGTRVNYREIWFTFYEDGIRHEGVCWKYGNLILAYGLNPYWNYDDDSSNFLERPVKPYFFFNFLRVGRWVYDDTSLTEQAASQQDNLEKRGFQIIDNADQANAAKVWNTDMIDPKDVQKYTGDPRDNILCVGDVRQAFARVPAPPLPRYVVEDKYDARREIDDIFGTHAPIRGSKTESPTLGQEVLSQRADLGRISALSEEIEVGATKIFRFITQLYKVFATEEHIVRYLGEEGRTIFVRFSSDKIEDGVDIRVQAGSLQPEDKLADRNEAVELAKIGGRLDPLTFAEKWHLPKPKEFAKRMFYFLFMPDKYAQETLQIGQAGGDEEAMSTIQQINAGDNIPPKKDASKEYVAYYGQFVSSPAFKQLDPEVQRLHIDHIRGTVSALKSELKEGESGRGEKKPNVMSRIVNRLRKEEA